MAPIRLELWAGKVVARGLLDEGQILLDCGLDEFAVETSPDLVLRDEQGQTIRGSLYKRERILELGLSWPNGEIRKVRLEEVRDPCCFVVIGAVDPKGLIWLEWVNHTGGLRVHWGLAPRAKAAADSMRTAL
jgi:hypothetical protein